MSESFEAWVQEMQLEYAAQIDQLKAELELVKKERDEARAVADWWMDEAEQRGTTYQTAKYERDEARALIAEIEAEDYWILEGQCTMQDCKANGKAIVAEARRRLARNAEMDSLEYTRK